MKLSGACRVGSAFVLLFVALLWLYYFYLERLAAKASNTSSSLQPFPLGSDAQRELVASHWVWHTKSFSSGEKDGKEIDDALFYFNKAWKNVASHICPLKYHRCDSKAKEHLGIGSEQLATTATGDGTFTFVVIGGKAIALSALQEQQAKNGQLHFLSCAEAEKAEKAAVAQELKREGGKKSGEGIHALPDIDKYINNNNNNSNNSNNSSSTLIFIFMECDVWHPFLGHVSYSKLTIDTVFFYFDALVERVAKLRARVLAVRGEASAAPLPVYVWSLPRVLKLQQQNHYKMEDKDDLEAIKGHLVLSHIMHANGLIVIPSLPLVASNKAEEVRKDVFLDDATKMKKLKQQQHEVFAKLQEQLEHLTIKAGEGSEALGQYLSFAAPLVKLQDLCSSLLNTRKYDQRCFPPPALLLPLLVTSLGGSGTHNVANYLFESCGLQVQHEGLGKDGSVSWMYAANDVYSKTNYPHHAYLRHRSLLSPRFSHVLHLKRHPLRHISSCTSHLNASVAFVERFAKQEERRVNIISYNSNSSTPLFLPRLHYASGVCVERGAACHLPFAASSWLAWHVHIARHADASFRVENEGQKLLHYVCNIVFVGKCKCSTMSSRSTSITTTEDAAIVNFSFPIKVQATSSSSSWIAFLISSLSTRGSLTGGDVVSTVRSRGSSKQHKRHVEFALSDVRAIDERLASDIQSLASEMGYVL